MLRNSYIVEAENGVGLYLSKYLAQSATEYLSERDRRVIIFDTYDKAQKYMFEKYGADPEFDLSQFRVNRTLNRDISQRFNFYVQSKEYIGYGISVEMSNFFKHILHVSSSDIIETESTREAEYCARNGFVEEYGNRDYYYSGKLLLGESISFGEMLKYNHINICRPSAPLKLLGSEL